MNYLGILGIIILICAHLELIAGILSKHLSSTAYTTLRKRAFFLDKVVIVVILSSLVIQCFEIFS